jgi:hypothetical protein
MGEWVDGWMEWWGSREEALAGILRRDDGGLKREVLLGAGGSCL